MSTMLTTPAQGKKPAPRDSSDYQSMPMFTPTPADISMFNEQQWGPTGPPAGIIPGMVEPGNIDLTKRPVVHHPDGSVSTLYSASFTTPKGEVLIPLVSPDGKMLSAKEAITLYQKTGQHLGIFRSTQGADAYANLLHFKQGAFQTWKNGGKFNPSVETWDNWTPESQTAIEPRKPIASVPAPEPKLPPEFVKWRQSLKRT